LKILKINFGILYGIGPRSLARGAGVSFDEAKDFIERYFHAHPGIAAYLDEMKLHAHADGYVSTLFGRRRYLPDIASGVPQLIAAAERMAVNHPVQGTAADLIKMAMIEVKKVIARSEETKQPYEKGEIRMTLQVHDELVFEVKKGLENKLTPLLKETMEKVVKLRVPIKVEVHSGKRWGEMK